RFDGHLAASFADKLIDCRHASENFRRRFQATKKNHANVVLRESPTVCGTGESIGKRSYSKRFSKIFSEARFWERPISASPNEIA
ncbi:MAG: hypothetical protein ACKO39_10985, partial [Chthoniobacterales bacterium]